MVGSAGDLPGIESSGQPSRSRVTGKGVGSETTVALLGDRDVDFLALLLGILKAGGIYLPLDAGYPDHGWPICLGESRAPVLLTTETYRQRVTPLIEGGGDRARRRFC